MSDFIHISLIVWLAECRSHLFADSRAHEEINKLCFSEHIGNIQ